MTTREVHLLLEYGYPFPDEERKLRSSKAVGGIHRVRLGAYWIELMLADLARSEREIRSRRLLDELWGRLRVPNRENPLDKQIAATAIINELTVVTRNIAHYAPTGVGILNPFSVNFE